MLKFQYISHQPYSLLQIGKMDSFSSSLTKNEFIERVPRDYIIDKNFGELGSANTQELKDAVIEMFYLDFHHWCQWYWTGIIVLMQCHRLGSPEEFTEVEFGVKDVY